LTAALCIVLVAAGLGIGALIWAGDDSSDDASTQPAEVRANAAEENAAEGDGDQAGDGEANDSWQTITVRLAGRIEYRIVNIHPMYNAWNNCVKTDATSPGNVPAPAHDTPNQVTLGVTTRGGILESCGYEESRMHWAVAYEGSGTFQSVELHKGAGGDVYAQCGPGDRDTFVCEGGGEGFVVLGVTVIP
jgi:hypothetical protein